MAVAAYTPAHVVGRRLAPLQDPRRTLEEKGLPVGGYIRISTAKDGQKTSIENQQKMLAEWAAVHGYRLVRFYIDVASGKLLHLRSELQELRRDVREGVIKGLVAKEISRTSRDVLDVLQLKRELASAGAFLIAVKEGYDSRKDDDEFLLVLHAALAQKERKTTAGRVKLTQLIKAREGRTNVPSPAFGYRLAPDKQRLVPDPTTAPVYRLIVERFLEGWGRAKICQFLNARGIPSKRGKVWHPNAVKVMLANPVYLGVTIYNATCRVRTPDGREKLVLRPEEEWVIREQTHEPLIDRETWERVQQLLARRRELGVRSWTGTRRYLGSGLLRCAVCGGRLFGSRIRNYLYYRCLGNSGRCPGGTKYWRMEQVDRLVLGLLRSMLADREKLAREIAAQTDLLAGEAAQEAQAVEELRHKLGRIEKAMAREQAAYEAEAITLEEYRQRLAVLRGERADHLTRLRRLEARLARAEEGRPAAEEVCARVAAKVDHLLALPEEEKRAYLDAVFEEIYLAPGYRITDVVYRA